MVVRNVAISQSPSPLLSAVVPVIPMVVGKDVGDQMVTMEIISATNTEAQIEA
jgi:hypothetical protein